MDYLIVTALVLLSALFSGLNLGLLSLDKQGLERKIELGDQNAKRVYAVRKRGNLLLCTLLVGNVAVNSAIAIYLNDMASGFLAGIIATALIVIFGEIVPQAAASRHAMRLGAATAWLVRIIIILLYPITAPLAWLLDRALGDEMPTIYSKNELMKIVHEHERHKDSDVDQDEYRIVRGALSYSSKTAEDVMTPRTVVYGLEEDDVLDQERLNEIRQRGFTRIPVFKEDLDHVTGLFYVKDMIGREGGMTVGGMAHKEGLLRVSETDQLDGVLNMMLLAKHHMAIVADQYGGTAGIVTMEDIVEEIIDFDIVDETDEIKDLQKFAMSRRSKESGQASETAVEKPGSDEATTV
jgi:metal transporter CNNM